MKAGHTPIHDSHAAARPSGSTVAKISILLASRSPRRRQLLQERGYRVRVIQSGFDDGLLQCGPVEPAHWVAALAYLKAEAGLRAVQHDPAVIAALAEDGPDAALEPAVVLGADTTVVSDGRIIGQPRDADDARRILHVLSDGAHEVITGVALLDLSGARRTFFHDSACVHVGRLSEEMVETYLAGGGWRGKAGAYNLRERLEAGWPIRYDGDPATIMGLPLGQLDGVLRRFCRL